ncbi:hypothetical protein NDU88_000936 [Pleurodeles waltl]|uniref:Uncharacterized protein n=1 Tax=Pleurodeles waltl TaxID=8319 RepID=A0AAV7NCT3_PLEWA|nr:hypothetical protein NDU88_000936 [Pleurodeles waltl]
MRSGPSPLRRADRPPLTRLFLLKGRHQPALPTAGRSVWPQVLPLHRALAGTPLTWSLLAPGGGGSSPTAPAGTPLALGISLLCPGLFCVGPPSQLQGAPNRWAAPTTVAQLCLPGPRPVLLRGAAAPGSSYFPSYFYRRCRVAPRWAIRRRLRCLIPSQGESRWRPPSSERARTSRSVQLVRDRRTLHHTVGREGTTACVTREWRSFPVLVRAGSGGSSLHATAISMRCRAAS